jgi:phosphoglycerate kinase
MSFYKLTIRDVPLDNKTVLVRADYNVPLTGGGEISDDLRIRASLPTIEYLLERGCKIVIISHLGRPEGRDSSLSLEPIAQRLAHLLRKDVRFVDECIGDKVFQAVKRAPVNSIIVLENLRFHKEEEANDADFAKKIADASGARYFVQDGFGVVHRAHASTSAITGYIPSVSGLLLEREYVTINSAMESPKRPLVAVIGGAKIKDKIPLIERFIDIADQIIIGGALANTFLAKSGVSVGQSKIETDEYDVIDRIYSSVKEKKGEGTENFILLPIDLAVGKSLTTEAKRQNISLGDVHSDDYVLDMGSQTIEEIVKIVERAGTVIWNGTLGYAELPEFSEGSARLAGALSGNKNITSIIGGGDTADFVLKWSDKNDGNFTHVSTGGGASLELMSGIKLPGIESLLDAKG